MRILKFAFVGLIAVGGVNVYAQEGSESVKTHVNSKEEKAEVKLQKLTDELNLTEEQQAKAKDLSDRFITRSTKIKADESITDEVKKAQLKAERKAMKEEFTALLDDSQKEKLKELKSDNKKSLEERAKKKTERMTEELGLNETQSENLYNLNLKVAQKIKAIKENAEFSDEKKKKFIKGNKKDYKTVLSSILTAEQMTKFEELKKERKDSKEK